MSETKPPDPDAEREVDLRSAWSRITARWYLPVAGLVIGAILGVLASASGGEVFRARTLLDGDDEKRRAIRRGECERQAACQHAAQRAPKADMHRSSIRRLAATPGSACGTIAGRE